MITSERTRNIEEAKIKVDILHAALNNSTNYETIFNITINSNNFQRQVLVDEYHKKYNKNLIEDLKKALSGEVKDIIPMMYYNPYELDARILHKSLHDKRDEKAIIEIIVSRPHWYLQIVDREYHRLFKISLKDDLEKDKKTEFKTFLLCLINTQRNTGQTIKKKEEAEAIAKKLSSNIKDYGKKVDLFKEVFAKRSREDLTLICRSFKAVDKSKKNLYDFIDDKGDSKTREILKALIYAVVLPSSYFAHLLKKSIVGAGTDNVVLNRVLVTRCEVDMDFIRNYYKAETKRELLDDIAGDTSGHYKTFTMMLANV